VATNSTLNAAGETLIQAKATGTNTAAAISAGGINGLNASASPTLNSAVKGPVTIRAESANKQNTYAGGIVGQGAAANSYTQQGVKVQVEAKSAANSSGDYDMTLVAAGGIAGQTPISGQIANCFSGAEVTLETNMQASGNDYAITAAGGLVGYLPAGGEIVTSYATGSVLLKNNHPGNVVFAGGLAGAGRYSVYGSLGLKNSAALNSSVWVETAAGEDAAYAYRVLGGALDGATVKPVNDVWKDDLILLSDNYALDTIQVLQKTTAESFWTPVNQGANNTKGLAGDDNITLSQDFFSGTLKWDFGADGRPGIWQWDNTLKLPVLNIN
jgi:hypothetical protein